MTDHQRPPPPSARQREGRRSAWVYFCYHRFRCPGFQGGLRCSSKLGFLTLQLGALFCWVPSSLFLISARAFRKNPSGSTGQHQPPASAFITRRLAWSRPSFCSWPFHRYLCLRLRFNVCSAVRSLNPHAINVNDIPSSPAPLPFTRACRIARSVRAP